MIIVTKDSQTGKLDITEEQLREILEEAKKEGREEALNEAKKNTITVSSDHIVDYDKLPWWWLNQDQEIKTKTCDIDALKHAVDWVHKDTTTNS